jgi:HlyD family secretion protein
MDIPRKEKTRLRRIMRRVIPAAAILALIGVVSFYTSKMEPAAPAVDRATIWIDTVKRGSMSRAVRGMGRLVPEEIRWIPATVDGLVERKVLEPGARVTPGAVIIELSNPQLERDTVNAEWDWKAAESGFEDFRLRLRSEELTQAADLARLESDYEQAQIRYEASLTLHKDGLIPPLDLRRDQVAAENLLNRIELEKQRAAIRKESVEAQLSERRTQVEKSRAMYELRKSQLEQLNVKAGVDGILQQIEVDVGQRIGMGTNLARVTNPNRLKAELSITETQAKDIQVGQPVSVDTRNGVVDGVVSRIDPSVRNGSVTVDVRFTEALPQGARPDLSVDGTIVLERLEDVIYTGLPVQGQANSLIGLFRLSDGGRTAERVKVQLGRTSVNTVEIQEGLQPGDQVILSDMSAQDGIDSIRIN